MTFGDESRPVLLPPTFVPPTVQGEGDPIAVLMSGGVDSSITALLLRDAGWSPVGITMKIPRVESCPDLRTCCGPGAALVCRDLGIPHYFVDTEATFRAYVIEPFRRAYLEGKTPSPCVDCNAFLKFRLVWDLVREQLGIEHLATGHYARVETAPGAGHASLKRAADKVRDQSYFLYGIPRDRLPFLHLPLGGLGKDEVRRLAAAQRLPVAAKPDSMELCFAGEGDYRKLLADVALPPGPICDTSGKHLGQHTGIHNYTIGQRRGTGISSPHRLYVIKIVPEENTVVVGTREEGLASTVTAANANVLDPGTFRPSATLCGKIRSIGEPEPCMIRSIDDAGMAVHFDRPVFGPAPGQHLVLYDAEENVVAGGVITL